MVHRLWLPIARAAEALRLGQGGEAIRLLEQTRPFERAGPFWPIYLRGRAFLHLKDGKAAAVEFRRIVEHPGQGVASPPYPLAHLGMGQALSLGGDGAGSRRAYEQFFEMWRQADPNIPLLIRAREEYAALKQ